MRQHRRAQTLLATRQINEQQTAVIDLLELRRQGLTRIQHGCKGRHDQAERCGHRFFDALLLPNRFHRHGILADRNGDVQCRTQLHAHGLHRGKQFGIFARRSGRGHPVGRQADVAEVFDTRRGDVGNRFRYRHARRCRSVDDCCRRAFTHGHRFAGVTGQRRQRHRAIRHRHLPGTNHLIARHHAGDGAIADGDQERFVGHGRMREHAFGHFLDRCLDLHRRQCQLTRLHIAVHARRFAKQHIHRHVDGFAAEMPISQTQLQFFGGFAEHGKRRAFAATELAERFEIFRRHGEHITFLGFVAPDLDRRHARFGIGNGAQFETTAELAVVHQFRHGIRQAASTDIVDRTDRVGITQRPAAVDHFLTATLHFRVVTLHRREIQIRGRRATGHR